MDVAPAQIVYFPYSSHCVQEYEQVIPLLLFRAGKNLFYVGIWGDISRSGIDRIVLATR